VILAAVLLYLVAQLAIGVWVSRRIASESDYLLAGRSLGPLLLVFSMFATWFGAETIVGSAGTVYGEGVSIASAEPYGYGLCLILLGIVFAVPLWRLGLTTLADFFRHRYSVRVERIAALVLIPGSVLWAAAQVRAFGYVLSTASTLDLDVAIGLAAAFTMVYTMFGGLLADAITDLIQGGLLVVGLVIVLVAVVAGFGGIGGTVDAIATASATRQAVEIPVLETMEAWAIPVFGSLLATEMVGRLIAARSAAVARSSAIAAGGLYLVIGSIPVVIGLAGPVLVPSIADAEQLIPTVARELLPAALYVLFAGGLISAILSTVDSTLLIASGLLSHNVIVPIARITNERTKVLVARAGVAGFGLLAYALALTADGVFELVETASAIGSAGALVTITAGLFTTWGGPRTAMATLIGGMVTYLATSFGGFAYPFLASLLCAAVLYAAGAISGGLTASRRPWPSAP
jgi:SSS family transporter